MDHRSISRNVAALRSAAAPAELMAVVKADGYGHGALEVARTALAAGATWLGVATFDEAIRLRRKGITAPTLFWLGGLTTPYRQAIERGLDIGVGSLPQLAQVVSAAAELGCPARIHLKIDTGLTRNGVSPADWAAALAAVRRAVDAGLVCPVGVWSHLARAEDPDDPVNDRQIAAFDAALAAAARCGVEPQVTHLANSAAVLAGAGRRYSLARAGIAMVGLAPGRRFEPAASFGLVPAMTLRASLANVKAVAAGTGISYGHAYRTAGPTRVGLVPLGYADGIPRAASGHAEVFVSGRRRPARGVIAMDQFVVDLGADPVEVGAEVLLYGPGDRGEPTVAEWAEAASTIPYEIVSRLGGRVPRRHVRSGNGQVDDPGPDTPPIASNPGVQRDGGRSECHVRNEW